VTKNTILNRECDKIPSYSNFLIRFGYDVHNFILKGKNINSDKVTLYKRMLLEAGGRAELVNQLFRKNKDCSSLVGKLKLSFGGEELSDCTNGFYCVFREISRLFLK